ESADEPPALTQAGTGLGTAGYMAPEQIEDARSVGPAADVFALGVVLFECVAGSRPFGGGTQAEQLARIPRGRAPSPRRARPEAPRWLDGVVQRALAIDPRKRFPDARAFARALDGRRRARWLPAAAIGLAGAVVSGIVLARRAASPAPPAAVSPGSQQRE